MKRLRTAIRKHFGWLADDDYSFRLYAAFVASCLLGFTPIFTYAIGASVYKWLEGTYCYDEYDWRLFAAITLGGALGSVFFWLLFIQDGVKYSILTGLM